MARLREYFKYSKLIIKKKILLIILLIPILTACNITSESKDMEMLQKKYDMVYRINYRDYITCDSIHTYHVKVNMNGSIESTIKIK